MLGTTSEKVTLDDFVELINTVDDILNGDESKNQNEETNVEAKEFTLDERDAFEKEFNRNHITRAFTDAVAAVMTISSMTGMHLDKMLELFVEKMRDELHAEDTKVMMDIVDEMRKLFNLLSEKEA